MTQTPMQKAVEAGAKAHHEAHCSNPDLLIPWEAQWDGVQHMLKEYMHKALTAALASLEADGWNLMPKYARGGEGMIGAGGVALFKAECADLDPRETVLHVYTAMFNAASEVE